MLPAVNRWLLGTLVRQSSHCAYFCINSFQTLSQDTDIPLSQVRMSFPGDTSLYKLASYLVSLFPLTNSWGGSDPGKFEKSYFRLNCACLADKRVAQSCSFKSPMFYFCLQSLSLLLTPIQIDPVTELLRVNRLVKLAQWGAKSWGTRLYISCRVGLITYFGLK